MRLVAVAALAVALSAAPARAQPVAGTTAVDTTAALVRLELADGTVLVGAVVREDEATVVLRMVGGAEVTVPPAQVRRRSAYEGVVRGGRLVRLDPNRTRLMFAPTARSLRAGQGYLAAYEIVLPFVAYGVGHGLSLSGGTVFAPGAFLDVFYAAPKLTVVETDGVAAAVGAWVIAAPAADGCIAEGGDGCSVGSGVAWGALPFAVGTFGGAERSVTVGVGVPVREGGVGGAALVLVGGELQVSGAVKLLTENYVGFADGETGVLLGGAVRFFGERLAADVGAFVAPQAIRGVHDVPFAPWLGFSYAVGR